jgi:hypothetical protein
MCLKFLQSHPMPETWIAICDKAFLFTKVRNYKRKNQRYIARKMTKLSQGYANKNSIQNAGYDTKHSKTSPMSRQIQQQCRPANEMPELLTKIHRNRGQNITH